MKKNKFIKLKEREYKNNLRFEYDRGYESGKKEAQQEIIKALGLFDFLAEKNHGHREYSHSWQGMPSE